jgi:hypothetical protein
MKVLEDVATITLQEAVGVALESQSISLEPPPVQTPEMSLETLLEGVRTHPVLQAATHRHDAAVHSATLASLRRRPSMGVGLDWIGVRAAPGDASAGAGQDALAVGVGLQLPIWQRAYTQAAQAAEAQVEASKAFEDGRRVEQHAAVRRWHALVMDSARQVQTIQGVLLPQADAVHAALLGQYTAGTAQLAQLLLAQRDLLELTIARDQALAEHARAWSGLTQACGQAMPLHDVGETP